MSSWIDAYVYAVVRLYAPSTLTLERVVAPLVLSRIGVAHAGHQHGYGGCLTHVRQRL